MTAEPGYDDGYSDGESSVTAVPVAEEVEKVIARATKLSVVDRLDGSPYCRGHAHIAHPSLVEKERAKAAAMERRLAAGRMTPGGTVRK